jgi:succinate dehydrogenase/fumarate reductase cytochrome b subunit
MIGELVLWNLLAALAIAVVTTLWLIVQQFGQLYVGWLRTYCRTMAWTIFIITLVVAAEVAGG